MTLPREEKPLPLEYSTPGPRPSRWRTSLPYTVFAVCALLAGLLLSWIPSAGVEYMFYVPLAVVFGLGAVVLPFLIQRDLHR